MGITTVARAEEHLTNTIRQVRGEGEREGQVEGGSGRRLRRKWEDTIREETKAEEEEEDDKSSLYTLSLLMVLPSGPRARGAWLQHARVRSLLAHPGRGQVKALQAPWRDILQPVPRTG
eukprot:754644-Hanusia_phi.AAC.4